MLAILREACRDTLKLQRGVHLVTRLPRGCSSLQPPDGQYTAGFSSCSSVAHCIDRKEHSQQVLPDISALHKTLQCQWDVTANAHLGNVVIAKLSRKKVWWQCHQCPDGHVHRWQAMVFSRSYGAGCPQCAGRKLCRHNSLATVAPKVAQLWDSARNGCTADMTLARSNKSYHWQCHSCSHVWTARPNSKVVYGSGCPECSHKEKAKPRRRPTFAQCQHPLLHQWDHQKNADEGWYPDNVTLGSGKKLHWLCNKCPLGHEHAWAATPLRRLSAEQTGCPFCAGKAACKCNSLQTHHPSIAAEWNYDKNETTPQHFTFGSTYMAWWHTIARGSWQQSINSRTNFIRRNVVKQHLLQNQLAK